MGVDLLIATLAIPVGKEPDWEAARALVRRMPDDQLLAAIENWQGDIDIADEDDISTHRTSLLELVDLVEEATKTEHRRLYASEYVVPGWLVWITGGESWGDSPSEEFDYFSAFLGAGYPGETLAQAAGFAHHFTDPVSQDPENAAQ